MIFKVLALVLALLGYTFSPYGPAGGPKAGQWPEEDSQVNKGSHYLATVIRVADGDTLTVRNRDGATHKIRLHGVDAPELRQAGGQQSHAWLTRQVLQKEVRIVVNTIDRYQRQVAKVVIPQAGCELALCDGETDVNLRAVEEGHAWWYRNYARSQSASDRALYERAENQARSSRKGLWLQPSPKAPWQWRTEQRNTQ